MNITYMKIKARNDTNIYCIIHFNASKKKTIIYDFQRVLQEKRRRNWVRKHTLGIGYV